MLDAQEVGELWEVVLLLTDYSVFMLVIMVIFIYLNLDIIRVIPFCILN